VARNRKRAKERRARRPEPALRARRERDEVAPAPIAHAAPDVEIAEAQLAVGRPEPEPESANGALEEDEAVELEQGLGEREAVDRGAEVGAPAHGAVAERGPHQASRLIAFLQGSWRELQRVQWPDRRQVMQATGVVIGFVIIAGLFLGAADYVASQIVKLILK
jgi:preprotein translocase SecE subunit